MDEAYEPTFERTERGFKDWAPIETAYGHVLRVQESSVAFEPHLWLWVDHEGSVIKTDAGKGTTGVHLTVEQAEQLIATLQTAIDCHFQDAEYREVWGVDEDDDDE
jgi:hypothetical protein